MKIQTQVVDYRVYNRGNRLFGHGDEWELPNIVHKTIEATLPGGKMSVPSLTTEDLETELPFNVFDREAASTITVNKTNMIVVRVAEQEADDTTHDFTYKGLKITMMGLAKETHIGTVKKGGTMDSKIKLGLTYIKIEDNTGYIILEHNKLTGTYIVNNEDVRAGIDQFL